MDEARKLRLSELRSQRKANSLALVDSVLTAGKDLGVQLLKNPATSMALSIALVEYLARLRAINDTERGLLVASIISESFLSSFRPVTIGGSQ